MTWPSFLPVLPKMHSILQLPAFPAVVPTAVVQQFPAFADQALRAFVELDKTKGRAFYAQADPLNMAFAFAAFNSFAVWLLGEITGNVSQVDRQWSFLPFLYTVHFTLHPLLSTTMAQPAPGVLNYVHAVANHVLAHTSHVQLLALATQLAWCLRLTFNGWRRGFFWPTTEDYRWIVLRKRWPKGVVGWLAWRVFNAGFIAVIQNLLLLAIALPSYYLWLQAPASVAVASVPSAYHSRKELGAFQATSQAPALGHWILAGLAVSCVVGQYVADGQQQVYQSWKHSKADKRPATKTWSFLGGLGGKLTFNQGDLQRGFISKGLWAYSRHPAFALEQTFWWLQALFPLVPLLPHLRAAAPRVVLAGKQAVQIARPLDSANAAKAGEFVLHHVGQAAKELPLHVLVGAAGLTALFIGSTLLTEGITAPKYPLYASAYQRRVGMFLPIQTYAKRLYLSVVHGNLARRQREAELGWRDEPQYRFKAE